MRYMDFFNSIAELFQKDEVTYDLSGSIGKFGLQVPFRKKGTIPVPKLPQVSLNRIDIKDLSFTKASLVVVLELINENDFKVGMDGLDYKLTLGNNELVNGKTMSIAPIMANGKSVLELPVNLNFCSWVGQPTNCFSTRPQTMKCQATSCSKYPIWGKRMWHF